MTDLLTYERSDGVTVITLDDGKVNALSTTMLGEISAALKQAEGDSAPTVLAGRSGRFSGGFDLAVIREGGTATGAMVRAGFELSSQMLDFPRPLVVACTGHAIAMAAFLLLSADYRIGADGDFKITANEVAIGLTLPLAAIELCRYRLTRPAADRALGLSEVFSPRQAVDAGWLDEVVPPDEVVARATAKATQLGALNENAHAIVKRRVREPVLAALRSAIDAELPATS